MKKTTSLRRRFPHQKLEVYHLASTFFVTCWKFADRNRFTDYFVRSQFLRAALSIKLNIAEGANEFSAKEKARFYRMARRSAGEVSSLIDDFPMILGMADDSFEDFYAALLEINVKLTRLIESMERRSKPTRAKKRTR